MPTTTTPQHGDQQGGTDAAGHLLWRAVFWRGEWFMTWATGYGYMLPPVRCDLVTMPMLAWRAWT